MPPRSSGPKDLDLLADLFADVQRLGEPPPRPRRDAPPARVAPEPAASAAPAAAAGTPAPAQAATPDEGELLRAAFAGVRPLAGPSGRPHAAPPHAPLPTPGRAFTPAAPRPSGPHGAPSAELFAHVERAKNALEAEMLSLKEGHRALQEQASELRELAHQANARQRAAVADLSEARAALASATLELERAADRDRERQRRLAELNAALPPTEATGSTDLRTLLTGRGLRGDDEMGAALIALANARRLGPLLTQFTTAHPESFAEFLLERLVLVSSEAPAGEDRATVAVAPERSDAVSNGAVSRAIAEFSEACLLAGKRRVLIVGGSPGYRKQLQAGVDARIQLTLVDGNKRNFRTPSRPDLTVVWGASELDHAASAHFPEAFVVNHRGISGMLERVTAHLRG